MKIKEFQELIRELYLERDRKRGLDKTFLWLVEEVGELASEVRNGELSGVEEELADVVAWATSVANLLDLDLEEVLKKKYGQDCYYCHRHPCVCTHE